MTTNVRPFHMFKLDVVRELQKAPFNWVGEAAFQMAAKHGELINASWNAEVSATDVCRAIHNAQVRTPVKKFVWPTKKSLEAVGCSFK